MLYSISNLTTDIEMALFESGGEITPEIELLIETLQENKEFALSEYVSVIKNLSSYADAVKTEESRLVGLRKSAEKRIELYKNYVLELTQGEAWQGGVHKVSFRNSSAVEVDAGFMEAKKYPYLLREKVTVEPDKTKIKEAIESGEEIEGARIVSRKSVIVK